MTTARDVIAELAGELAVYDISPNYHAADAILAALEAAGFKVVKDLSKEDACDHRNPPTQNSCRVCREAGQLEVKP